MSDLIQFYEKLLKDNYKRLSSKTTGQPIETLAQAYTLSIHHGNMTKDEIQKMANNIIAICDEWADMMEKSLAEEGPHCTSEWEPVTISYLHDLVKEFIPPEKLKRWSIWALAYCDIQMQRPFYYTAYNHEIMRCMAMYLCGQSFNRPDLIQHAIYFAKQLMHYCTPLGFWEEGPHHGTSLRYNYIMIHGLAWVYRLSNEESLKLAIQNLNDFMATYSYPDGATVGPLDGRQTAAYSQTMFMTPGLELSTKGQALFMRHTNEFYKAVEKDNFITILENFFAVSTLLYYKKFNIPTPKDSSLSLDQDNFIESHSNLHETVMQRKGDWACCVSGHAGQIPKEAQSIFRLERQSRIELWHKDFKFIIGGGHNKIGNKTPYTNVIMATGFKDTDFDYGLITTEDKKANHAMYFARAAKTYIKDNVPHVTSYFAHATITFSVHILNNKKVTIKWQVEQLGLKKIAIQIPVVVPKNSEIYLDNKKIECTYLGQNNLNKGSVVDVRTDNKPVFKITTNNNIGLRYPNMPLITYVEDEINFFDKVNYYIAFLSNQFENPAPTLTGSWEIELA